jgi:hypothetical protein
MRLPCQSVVHARSVSHVSEHLGGVSTLRLLMSACVSQARFASRVGQLSILVLILQRSYGSHRS